MKAQIQQNNFQNDLQNNKQDSIFFGTKKIKREIKEFWNLYKIIVVGTGYVGLSNAILLAKENEVLAFDIDNSKIEKLRKKFLLFRIN